MKQIVLLACAAFALTGCTTIGSLFADNDKGPTPIEQANAYVPLARPMPADFCQRVGTNARQEALRAGFDDATQQRIAVQNLQQCESFNQPQYASL
jgi:hypothetical protein